MIDLNNCFLATIWPTNEANVLQIAQIVKAKGYGIRAAYRYTFDSSWDSMVRMVYQDDRTKERNLKFKIDVMSPYEKVIYLLYIVVPDPKYRTKPDGRKISTLMEDLKRLLRGIFGGKKTKQNPIHIVDEVRHSINLHNKLTECGEFHEDDRCIGILE